MRDIDDFVNVVLAADTPALKYSAALRDPHRVKAVELPDNDWTFPLKLGYDRVNYTLEGRKEAVQYVQPTLNEHLEDYDGHPLTREPAGDNWVKNG